MRLLWLIVNCFVAAFSLDMYVDEGYLISLFSVFVATSVVLMEAIDIGTRERR